MRCPSCGYKDTKVIDSRPNRDAHSIRRRRECLKCGFRFTTYEIVELSLPIVIKKDGRKEPFEGEKLRRSIKIACTKRPISTELIESIASSVETAITLQDLKEIPSDQIGNLILQKLKKIDEVAYVRFASVYKEFKSINEFMKLIENMAESHTNTLSFVE